MGGVGNCKLGDELCDFRAMFPSFARELRCKPRRLLTADEDGLSTDLHLYRCPLRHGVLCVVGARDWVVFDGTVDGRV